MADLKISVELSLDELRNLWYLIQNTRQIIKYAKDGEPLSRNWITSQEMNLSRLKDLNDKIELIAER